MNELKISFFGIKRAEAFEKRHIKNRLNKHKLLFFKETINEEDIKKAKNSDIISVFINSKVTKEILKNFPKLRMIATRSTGFDHIDLKTCRRRKIVVANVPFYGENTVAEHTFGLILSLSRHIHKSYVRTMRDDFSIEGLTGFDLKGKTLGVIGAGHIGLHVIKIAKGFGMNVLAFDMHKNKFVAEVLGFEYTDLDTLLSKSDIITLHTPLNKYTRHIINKKNIEKIKKGAILINTARGELVDTNALYDALMKKKLAGAGLDVIEGEQMVKEEHQRRHKEKHIKWKQLLRDYEIFKMDNVVFTPHNAFNSREAIRRIIDTTIDNIISFAKKKPKNVVS
ncbi:hydroxyacid dehydrogenase [Candidatus Woesearchaeota archaeon]|nr:hydroxyacid dehydrogenase [Candidatus Woesearchaeota archaeon]